MAAGGHPSTPRGGPAGWRRDLALYTGARIGVIVVVAVVLGLLGVPVVIAALVGVVAGYPLSLVLLRKLGARVAAGMAQRGARRAAERAELRAQLRGESTEDHESSEER
ncbi:MAG: DUF4229 domain-containing protein [Sciscionella sp.]